MAETTHTLKFRADARAIKVLGQEFQKAFDTRSPKAYQQELTGLQRRLKDLTAVQTGLAKQLERTSEGTKAFEKLEAQLKTVGREAKVVRGAIGSMTTAYRDFNAERKKSFVAGLGQGLGIAHQIPTDAGMAQRMAGAVVGRGIRGAVGRVGGAAMAPIRQPGVGGLASMVGAIPVVGEMAAGQIQALAGMYQEAVAFRRQARGALFAQGAGFTPSQRSARMAAAEEEVTRVRRQGQLAQEQAKEMTQAEFRRGVKVSNRRAQAQEKILQASGGLSASPGFGALITSNIEASRVDVSDIEEDPSTAVTTRGGRRTVRGMYGRTAKFRRGLGAEQSVERVRQRTRDRIKAIRRRARAQPTGLPRAAAGVRFGFGPQEMMGQFTQYMQARGGTFDDVRRRDFVQQMAATTMGVTAGQAGQLGRMGVAGGGGMGAVDLAGVLSSAVSLGLRGSQVPEYLQTLVTLGQEAERTGVKIDERAFTRQAGLLQALGFRGPQVGRVAGGVNRAAMQLSQRGVSSPVDMIMLRAAGYDPSSGPEGYAAAINKIEGGMDLPMLERLMGMATQGATGGIGATGRQTSILMMKRFFGRMGTPMSAASASGILDAYQEGKLGREHVQMLNRNMASSERKDTHGWLTKEADRRIGRGAGTAKTEAAMEAERVKLGEKMSGTMVKLNEASINAASAVASFSSQLKGVATTMANVTKGIEKISKAFAGGKGWDRVLRLMTGEEG